MSTDTGLLDRQDRKTVSLIDVLRADGRIPSRPRTLVVGCGDGAEAGLLAREFGGRTDGIDLGGHFEFGLEKSAPAELRVMDAHRLEYPDDTFDFVFSFHALEHMQDPEKVLAEMSRVLKPGGVFLVGTPNSRRIVGYLGAKTALSNKIRWNLADLWMRATGRWSNQAGAHAGFSEAGLSEMCRRAFSGDVRSVNREYYSRLYGPNRIGPLFKAKLYGYVLPCVYVLGQSGKVH